MKEKQIQKHIDRFKYYRLMKYKMHKKMMCEFRTLERLTHQQAREFIKRGQIDEEMLVDKANQTAKVDFCSSSCKPVRKG